MLILIPVAGGASLVVNKNGFFIFIFIYFSFSFSVLCTVQFPLYRTARHRQEQI